MQTAQRQDSFWLRIIYVLSIVVSGAVAFLILGPRPAGGGLDVSGLPIVNASLNGLTTVLLLVGFVLIKNGKETLHRKAMLGAFTTSAAFLVSYVIYHWFKAGPRPYLGEFKGIYLIILGTHIVLAAAILPLAMTTLFRGLSGQREKHRKIARVTFPIWLYVSVTGVTIYFMLY